MCVCMCPWKEGEGVCVSVCVYKSMHVLGKAGVGGCVFSLLKTTSDGVVRLV